MHPLTPEERTAFEQATSYDEAALVAIEHARRRFTPESPLVQVCGPISTGGLGDRDRNLLRLYEAMDAVHELGHSVFNQLQFEGMVKRFSPNHGRGSYDHEILTKFYRQIFNSNYIQTLVFIEGWESSVGARYEYNAGMAFGLNIVQFEDFLGPSFRR